MHPEFHFSLKLAKMLHPGFQSHIKFVKILHPGFQQICQILHIGDNRSRVNVCLLHGSSVQFSKPNKLYKYFGRTYLPLPVPVSHFTCPCLPLVIMTDMQNLADLLESRVQDFDKFRCVWNAGCSILTNFRGKRNSGCKIIRKIHLNWIKGAP